MILGMSVESFTKLHVAISLIGILSGLIAVLAMVGGRQLRAVTALFLVTTILTNVTGFFFHSKAIGPPHIVGVISLIVLAAACYALYVRLLAGVWRAVYVVTAVIALWLNTFVGVAQAFQKVGALAALAPNGNEPPFLIAQLAALGIFSLLGFMALRNFKPAAAA
jgi:hypothetical protein